MGIINTNIVEEIFEKSNSSNQNLSILISVDRFSYAIFDQENKLLVLKSYEINSGDHSNSPLNLKLQDVFLNDELLKLSYGKVLVGLMDSNATLVPNKLFEEEEKETYLKNQVNNAKNFELIINHIEKIGAKIISGFDQESYYLIKGYLPNAQFFHSNCSLINGILNQPQTSNDGKRVFLNVKGNQLQISVFENSDLIFMNSFGYDNEHDFIYHVLLVYNQFNLSTGEIPIYLSGDIATDSKIYRIVYRYINNIQFTEMSSSIEFGDLTKNLSPHFYFDLFSLGLCE